MGTIADVKTEEATDARKTNTFRRGTARADSYRRALEDQAETTEKDKGKSKGKKGPKQKAVAGSEKE